MSQAEQNWLDYGTGTTGGLLAMIDGGAGLVTLIGLIVGIGGFACGLSREVRAWLDRREAAHMRSMK